MRHRIIIVLGFVPVALAGVIRFTEFLIQMYVTRKTRPDVNVRWTDGPLPSGWETR